MEKTWWFILAGIIGLIIIIIIAVTYLGAFKPGGSLASIVDGWFG